MRRLRQLLIVALACLGLAMAPLAGGAQSGETVSVSILSVVDGFTLQVALADGTTQQVRLAGISAPERPLEGLPPSCFGPESSARLTQLVAGQHGILEFDDERQDRAGRTLGYLWLTNDFGYRWMVNERLVAEGYARQLTNQPNARYATQLRAAEQAARDQGLRLWTACAGPTPDSETTHEDGVPPPSTLLPGHLPQVCDAAYPTVCIPPPLPILSCNDIPDRGFEVLAPDPHRLDPDGNGMGCD